MDHWLVVMSGSKLVDEVRKRPEEQLSLIEGIEDVRFLYTLRLPVFDSQNHAFICIGHWDKIHCKS